MSEGEECRKDFFATSDKAMYSLCDNAIHPQGLIQITRTPLTFFTQSYNWVLVAELQRKMQ